MNIFQNLCPHESILMILGIVLFAALIFVLIWSVVKEKKVGILLPFFLLPVIMVGYPSLGTIKYENNKFELENQKQKLFEGDFSLNSTKPLRMPTWLLLSPVSQITTRRPRSHWPKRSWRPVILRKRAKLPAGR